MITGYDPLMSSQVTWFVPTRPVEGLYAIYHEGHFQYDSGSGMVMGAETIDWLLDRGYNVVAIDLPMYGVNQGDTKWYPYHDALDWADHGIVGPISLFLLPVKAVVDTIYSQAPFVADMLMVGRSGGGWATIVYSAIDPRITTAVPVAGASPLSIKLRPPNGVIKNLGDYEQHVPFLYDVVTYEELMRLDGSTRSLLVYNSHDPCCYAYGPDEGFIQYLKATAVHPQKPEVWVDEQNDQHSLSKWGYIQLDDFLNRLYLTPGAGGNLVSRDGSVLLQFPSGAVTGTVEITTTVTNVAPHDTAGFRFANRAFVIRAADLDGAPVASFQKPFTLTLSYQDADWQNTGVSDEADLNIYYWHDNHWTPLWPCVGCLQDMVSNKFEIRLDHLSDFALMDSSRLYLPLSLKYGD